MEAGLLGSYLLADIDRSEFLQSGNQGGGDVERLQAAHTGGQHPDRLGSDFSGDINQFAGSRQALGRRPQGRSRRSPGQGPACLDFGQYLGQQRSRMPG